MNVSSTAAAPNRRALRLSGAKSLRLSRKNKAEPAIAGSGSVRSFITGILEAAVKVPLNQEPASNAGAQ